LCDDCSSITAEACRWARGVRESMFLSRAMDDSGQSAEGAPNPQSFGKEWNKLLEVFDPDSTAALQKYQVARAGLVCLFRVRGLENDAEDLADEVMDRVLRHLTEKASTDPIRDLSAFIFSIAKNVALESFRHQRTVSFDDERDTVSPALWNNGEDQAQLEAGLKRLDTVLDRLPRSQRLLITRYYQYSKTEKIRDRAAIAQELGVTAEALRVRVCKIRRKIAKLFTANDPASAIGADNKPRSACR
jgi:RNA polymerase sigma factor (sigma-70 family)